MDRYVPDEDVYNNGHKQFWLYQVPVASTNLEYSKRQ